MRFRFEELMHHNRYSITRDGDNYEGRIIQSMWVAFQLGWIKAKEYANG